MDVGWFLLLCFWCGRWFRSTVSHKDGNVRYLTFIKLDYRIRLRYVFFILCYWDMIDKISHADIGALLNDKIGRSRYIYRYNRCTIDKRIKIL